MGFLKGSIRSWGLGFLEGCYRISGSGLGFTCRFMGLYK